MNKENIDPVVAAANRTTAAVQGLLNFMLYNIIGAIVMAVGICMTAFWHLGDSCDVTFSSCTPNTAPQTIGALVIVMGAIFTLVMSIKSITDALEKSSLDAPSKM